VATRSSPITVGRDRELARIDAARAAAAEGRPQIVIVRGEAGIGKTRLVGDAIGRAREAGSQILHGACLDLEGEGLPYLPLVEALRNYVRSTPRDRALEVLGAARADLGALVPEIADLERPPDAKTATRAAAGAAATGAAAAATGAAAALAPRAASLPDAPAERARLFERLLGFLGRLGSPHPAFAVIEDVQWIDPATKDLITYLVRNVTTERLVAVLTCRTDDLAPGHPVLAWLAELSRAPGAIRLELGRLDRADVERQLEAVRGTPVAADVADAIWARSEGHPLFVEELVAAAEEPGGDGAPPSLIEILLGRIARLDAPTLHVVRALAVAGGPLDERLLSPLVDRPPAEIGAALREAAAVGVLTVRPDGRHQFRHELLREIVERDLAPSERRDLHRGFAHELATRPDLGEDRPAAATAELARHWAGADEPDEAHRAAIDAADAAEAVHAFGDAHRQLERAMALEPRLTGGPPPATERVAIRRRAATLADLAGAPDRAMALIRDGLAIATDLDDARTTGLLHARMAYLTWASGDPERALEAHRRAVDLVPEEPPSVERAAVLGGLGGALMGLGRWAESRPICEAAIACAVRIGAAREESRARAMLGSDLVGLGEIEAGLDELRAAHRLAGPEPDELWVVTGHNLALNLLATDRLDEAEAVNAEAIEGARRGGLERRYGMDLAALRGDILSRLGRWDEADAITAAGVALDQRRIGSPYLAVVRSRLMARRGRIADARQRIAAIDRRGLEPDLAVLLAATVAEIDLLDDRPDGALATVEEALPGFLATGDVFWGVGLLALGSRAAAELAEAARAGRDDQLLGELETRRAALAAQVEAMAPRVLTRGGAASLGTARAEMTRFTGQPDPDAWSVAASAWDDAGDVPEAAYARFRSAEAALRRAGIRADVGSGLRAAWRTAVQLDATWLRQRTEELAGRARVALAADDGRTQITPSDEGPAAAAAARTPGRGTPRHRLSGREIEVLRLVAAGRSNGEIGDALFITRKTAGVHVTHILDKLGVSNRVEAAMAAARLGLLEDPDDPAAGERDQPA
jgi:DNA-binding CsgD family transcriptional regulator